LDPHSIIHQTKHKIPFFRFFVRLLLSFPHFKIMRVVTLISYFLITRFSTSHAFSSVSNAVAFGMSATEKKFVVSSTKKFMSSFDDSDFLQETPDQTKQRIQDLVDEHPVLLFMKGSKLFPQCGFSNTAVQILNTFNLQYHTGMLQSCMPCITVLSVQGQILYMFFNTPHLDIVNSTVCLLTL
jgi:Glutaredoxin-related protein